MSQADFIAPLYRRTRRSNSVAAARRIALSILVAAIAACDSSPRENEPAPPVAQDSAPAPVRPEPAPDELSLSERCEKTSRDMFYRDWQDGIVTTTDGQFKADYASHFNAERSVCYYLLTVNQCANRTGEGGAAAATLRRNLFDINTGELYGEYLDAAVLDSPPAARRTTCRVESFYCASEREWEVLVEPYMEVSRVALSVDLPCLRSNP